MFDQLKRLLKHFKNHENDIKINVNILQHDTGGIKVVIGLYKNISEIQTVWKFHVNFFDSICYLLEP